LDGALGEVYLLTTPENEAIYLHSCEIGGEERIMTLPSSQLEAVALQIDDPFVNLSLQTVADAYTLRFAAADRELLAPLATTETKAEPAPAPAEQEACVSAAETAAETAANAAAADEGEPPTTTLFCAAVYAAMLADGTADIEEFRLLNRLVPDSSRIAAGLTYLREHGTVSLLQTLDTALDQRQKLFLLANILEITMSDSVIHGTEKRLLRQFRDALHVQQDDYNALYEIVLLKNDTSVLNA
jgi:uncharacterized tellurite resistance protein B-like protein